MALPIYTHIPNLKVLTKIFFKLSRPKGNLCGGGGGGGVTVLNPKYPRLSSGDTIIQWGFLINISFKDRLLINMTLQNPVGDFNQKAVCTSITKQV